MKKLELLFLGALFYFPAMSQTFEWSNAIGSTGVDVGYAIVADNGGNVYSTGSFTGTTDFDPGPGVFNLSSSGTNDIFISKVDSNGDFVWAKSIGNTSGDTGFDIIIDNSGNLILVGGFSGIVDFDPGVGVHNLTSVGSSDVFILKLDNSGNFIWAKGFGGFGGDAGYGLSVDDGNNIYSTGVFLLTTDFDPGTGIYDLTSNGNSDVFISKLDSDGNFIWAKAVGGTGNDIARSLVLDGNNDVIATGDYVGTLVDFDPGIAMFNLSSNGLSDVFILKLDSDGNLSWAKTVGSTANDKGYGLTLDGNDNIISAGSFIGTVDFDPNIGIGNLTSFGSQDAFLLKLNSSGDYVFSKQVGGTLVEEGLNVVTDANGDIYLSGYTNDMCDLDPGAGVFTLLSAGISDFFLAKINSSGDFQWAKINGGTGVDIAEDIYLDFSGNIYSIGRFAATVDFDPDGGVTNLTSNGLSDIFVQKMGQCLIPSEPNASAVSICSGNTATLSASGSGTLSWYSAPTGGTYLGSGASFTTPVLTLSTTYYVQDSTCTASSRTAVTVMVNPLPSVTATILDITPCEGDDIFFDGNGSAMTFNWTGPNGFTSPLLDPPGLTASMLSTGLYTLTATNMYGCMNAASVTITVMPLPTISAGSDQEICVNESVTLSGSGGVSYVWDNGVTDGVQFFPISDNTYTVIGTDANGCSNTDQVDVIVNSLPDISAGDDIEVCAGDEVTLSGAYGETYFWTGGVIDGVPFVPAATQTYVVTGTDANGCSNIDQVVVTVNELPMVTLSITTDWFCYTTDLGGPSVSGGSPSGGSYTGAGIYDNSGTPSFAPSDAGIGDHEITYSFIDANGCLGSAVDIITVSDCSGLSESSKTYLTVYPNPSQDILVINVDRLNTVINITDASGKLVLTFVPDAAETIIDCGGWESGVYFVTADDGNQVQWIKY